MKTFLRITTVLGILAVLVIILLSTFTVLDKPTADQTRFFTIWIPASVFAIFGMASALVVLMNKDLWSKSDELDFLRHKYVKLNNELEEKIRKIGVAYINLKEEKNYHDKK